jgi:hypothetical protein
MISVCKQHLEEIQVAVPICRIRNNCFSNSATQILFLRMGNKAEDNSILQPHMDSGQFHQPLEVNTKDSWIVLGSNPSGAISGG